MSRFPPVFIVVPIVVLIVVGRDRDKDRDDDGGRTTIGTKIGTRMDCRRFSYRRWRALPGFAAFGCPEWSLTSEGAVQYPVHIMNAMTYTEAREKLSDTISRVCENHDPVVITKRRDRAVVMISLEDYEALVETTYLLRSPRNARRLLESIQQLEEGRGRQRKLAV